MKIPTLQLTLVGALALSTLAVHQSPLRAQEHEELATTECGKGYLALCGEVATRTCGWKWQWRRSFAYPVTLPLPTYVCGETTREYLYGGKSTHKASGRAEHEV